MAPSRALFVGAVDLDHRAVDLPVDGVPIGLPIAEIRLDIGEARLRLRGRRHRQSASDAHDRKAVMRRERDADSRAERMHPQAQRARRGDLRVLRRRDPAAALRGFAKTFCSASRKPSFSSSNARTGRSSHRDSTTAGGSSIANVRGTPSTVRTFAVMSSPTRPSPRVAARTSTPRSVRQRARDAIDLQLADEPIGWPAEAPREPVGPGLQLLGREGVVERQHRRPVLHRCEQRRWGRADALGWRIGRHRSGEHPRVPQLADESIVVGVADLGIVEHVVPVRMVVEPFAQLLDPHFGLGAGAFVTGAHPAISTAPANPIRSPTTTTPPRTPGTRRR